LGKTRNKNHSEVEHYRGIIKEYEAEIRRLKKQLRAHEKYERSQDEDVSDDTEDTYVNKKLVADCGQCGKGKLVETIEILGKVYGECHHCGARGKIR
jgi:RNA polymerase-binding transcription factor DksA